MVTGILDTGLIRDVWAKTDSSACRQEGKARKKRTLEMGGQETMSVGVESRVVTNTLNLCSESRLSVTMEFQSGRYSEGMARTRAKEVSFWQGERQYET